MRGISERAEWLPAKASVVGMRSEMVKGQVMYGLPGHGKTDFYTSEMGNH